MKPDDTEKETTGEDDPRSGCFIGCLEWLSLKLKLVDEGATPPNWKYILLIYACLFSSSISLTFLFPFLPEMILHLGYSENEKGMYGGLIAASVFGGRIFGSMFWGWLTDIKGRKFVLLLTILLNGLVAGLFGFSVNIPMAMFLRFLCGLVNGIVGTAKAALYDVSDNSNQAIGMTFLSISWGAGLVAGPLLGGILASPCSKWPDMCSEDSFFGQFPFLLPSLFPTVVSIAVFPLILFKFDETLLQSSKRNKEVLVSQGGDDEDIDTDVPPKKVSIEPRRRLLLNHSTSENKEDRPQNQNSLLSASVMSLNPEAEMSVCFGKKALLQQQSNEMHDHVHAITKSQPELAFTLDQGFDVLDLNSVNAFILSKSTSHIQRDIQNDDSSVIPKSQNGFSNGVGAPIYRPNGVKNKHSDVTSSSLQKIVLSVENETDPDSESNKNVQPLLQPQAVVVDDEEQICECCDKLFNLRCCLCHNTNLHKLLRLSDIWASIMLYTVMSIVTIGVDDLFPVFASTRTDYGGLGFSSNEIGMALGFVTLPLLVLQVKLYPFIVSRIGIRMAFVVMSFVCLVTSQAIPTLRVFNNNPTALWICLVLIQVPFKIAVNCCFASTSLLINNSASSNLAGQANGLGMTTTAIGRTMAPIVAGSMFTWTVTYGQFIGSPFDTGFPFFVLGILYAVSILQCYFINPRLDKQKK